MKNSPPPWLQPARALGLRPAILQAHEVGEARRLLYDVYFLELGWDPKPNPSGLRADHSQHMFLDDLDDRAIWLGVYAGPKLVATMRLLDQRDGPLELERYTPVTFEPRTFLLEANRIAVRSSHRHTATLPLLHTLASATGRRMGASHSVGTTSRRLVEKHAISMGFKPTGESLRYHPTDSVEAVVITYDFSIRHQLHVFKNIAMRKLARAPAQMVANVSLAARLRNWLGRATDPRAHRRSHR